MIRRFNLKVALLPVLAVTLTAVSADAGGKSNSGPRRLSMAALEDKVRGGWVGQMIGVSYGAPTEFRYRGQIIEEEIPWSPDRVDNSIDQDDLYVEMTFAEVMDRVGLDATTEQYGEAFKNSQYLLWHANASARRALNLGIKAPWSGHPKYNSHANDIDFQIEADFIGLMTPGLPRESNRFCDRVGRVMNYGDGLYGGMFVSGMYSAAFFEKDPRKLVEAGLACIPAKSQYGQIIQDVLNWHRQHPTDWRKTWQLVQDKWDRDDHCPDGALQPLNIDAKINGAYIAIGMLYGEGDFAKTIEISTRCGQDSDCNPASAAGVLGVVLGYSAIPDEWKSGIPALADKKFSYTDYSLNDVVRSTVDRARKVVQRVGGRVTEAEIVVPQQSPRAPKLEQWDMGSPKEIIPTDAAAWTWSGKWDVNDGRISIGAGSEATLRFNGTAVIIYGHCLPDGGRADVYLDGKKVGVLDSYIPDRTYESGLWHTYDLKPGEHTVRIVTRDDAAPNSTGKKIHIRGAIPFQARK